MNRKVDAILVNPVQTGSLQPDDKAAGAREAQMMMGEIGGQGNVVVLQGPLGGSDEIDRGAGIDEVLAKYSTVKVLAQDRVNWKRDGPVNKRKNWISAFGSDIDGVISQNDDRGLGALQT